MYIQSLQPAVNSTYLDIVADKLEKVTIKFLGAEGWVAKKVTTEVNAGRQQLDLNLNDLANGIYIVNAFIGDVFVKSVKFVKQ